MRFHSGVIAAASPAVGRSFSGDTANRLDFGTGEVGHLLSGAAAVTVVARVRATGSGNRTVFGVAAGNANGIVVGVDTTGVASVGGRSVSTDSFQSKLGSTALGAGWRTVAGILDFVGDTITVYLDGVADTSGSTAVTFANSAYTVGTPTGTDRIGANAASLAQPFDGDVCDVAVYKYAVSPSDLALIAAGTRPDQIAGVGPVCYWPLDAATDGGGRFAYPRAGGQVGAPVGDVPPQSGSAPALDAHTSAPWRRFDRHARVFRLRAADASSAGTGNAVSAVEFHGSGVSLSQSGSARPTYQEVSGRSVLRFDGSDDFLSAAVGRVDTRKGLAVVCLANVDAAGRIFSHAAAVDEGSNAYYFHPADGLGIRQSSSPAFSTYADYSAGSSGLALFSGRHSGTEVKNWLNGEGRNGTVSGGTEQSDGSFRPTTLTDGTTTRSLFIGKREQSAGTALFCDMDLTDLVIVVGAVTDEEVQYLEGVLAWENDATSLLPTDHPWKNTQPTASSAIAYPWGPTVMARSLAPNTSYTGSPSICRRSNGHLIAAHDFYNAADTGSTGRVYRSTDGGASWHGMADLSSYQWGTVWEHTDGHLYLLATTRAYGDLRIGKSTDGGATWTFTTLSNESLLAAAGSGQTPPNYHRAGGLPPCYANGHLYLACENHDNGSGGVTWASGFKSFVLYAGATADLTDAGNWKVTSQLSIGSTGLSDRTEPSAKPGFLEGNVVADDAGALWNVLRLGGSSTPDRAVFIPLTWTAGTSTLAYPSWDSAYIKPFPGGQCKFQLVRSGAYFYALTSSNTADAAGGTSAGNDQDPRNRVGLVRVSSADLSSVSASEVSAVIDEADVKADTGMSAADSLARHGFQYPAVAVSADGSTLFTLYRAAWSGAEDYHDANFIGFGSVSL